jgi:DNA-binding transcriptional LysR family regulator
MEREALSSLRRSEDILSGLALPQVEYRELRYFVAVAEELHFTNAAQRLEMSQPPLSAAIALLESKLGTRLFERDSRNVRLTPAGVALLQHARPILRQVNDAVEAARHAERGVRLVRLVTDSVSAATTVPALSLALERASGGVDLHVEQLLPGEIPVALLAGNADVAVFVTDERDPGLESDLLRSVAPVAVFAQNHPLAKRRRVSLADLTQHRLALWPEDQSPGPHRLVLSLFEGLTLEQGIAILPIFSGEWSEELGAGAFCVLPQDGAITADFKAAAIAGVKATFDTRLAWSRAAPPPFLDAIREAAAGLRVARGCS